MMGELFKKIEDTLDLGSHTSSAKERIDKLEEFSDTLKEHIVIKEIEGFTITFRYSIFAFEVADKNGKKLATVDASTAGMNKDTDLLSKEPSELCFVHALRLYEKSEHEEDTSVTGLLSNL